MDKKYSFFKKGSKEVNSWGVRGGSKVPFITFQIFGTLS